MAVRLVSRPSGFLLFVVFILSFVSGCASTGGMKNVSEKSFLDKPPNQSLVMGRLLFLDNSSGWVKGVLTSNDQISGFLSKIIFASQSESISDNKDLFHEIMDTDGYFVLIMEPGKYSIEQIESSRNVVGGTINFAVPTDISFDVPSGKSIYIGSIMLTYRYSFAIPFIKREEFEHSTEVLDKFAEDITELKEKYPFLPEEILNLSSQSN